jgi:hypothetical protein
MKSSSRYILTGILLFAITVMITSGCKKKVDDPVPVFSLTYDSVALVAGGKGLQFKATCTNNGVNMAKVVITNPTAGLSIYEFNGAAYGKNVQFGLQADATAYIKQKGTWKFSLTGSSSEGTAFAVEASVAVAY